MTTSLPTKFWRLVSLSKRSLAMIEQASTMRSTAPTLCFFLNSLTPSWLSFSSISIWMVPWKAIRQALSSLSMSGLQPITLKPRLAKKSFQKVITANIFVESLSLAYAIIYSLTSAIAKQLSLGSSTYFYEQNSLNSPSTVWWPDIMLNRDLFLIGRLKSRTRCRSITHFLDLFRQPGVQAIPLSTRSASRWCISMAMRSPCLATCTGFLNISIDLILHFCWISHSYISSPGLTLPSTTVPVMTVPFPLILKQWSMRQRNLLSCCRSGRDIWSSSTSFNLWLCSQGSFLAEKGTITTFYPNLVLENTFLKAAILASRIFLSSTRSALFSTTTIFFIKSSAIMMHSAVWAWMPLVASITRNIRSMIWAPPIMVFMREAWPGQSTSVNCRYSSFTCDSNLAGTLVKKAEKPRSRVIPLSCDCGFLSRLAVDATSVSILQMDVLPESTCPSTPTLILMHLLGRMFQISSLLRSKSSFYMRCYIDIRSIDQSDPQTNPMTDSQSSFWWMARLCRVRATGQQPQL